VPRALFAVFSVSLRRLPLSISAVLSLFAVAAALPLAAQDDITTRNATSGYNGAFITGPASNPLSFLNGTAFRTTANPAPYDFHDFAPATYLDEKLPKWIDVQAEERFRYEAYDNNNLKAKVDDSYILNRFRFQVDLHTASWLRVTAQVQDARSGFQNPPIGPPNTVRWDLKLAYVEVGAPEEHWFSLRVGRQLINYNNTIISNSEWRNQARSYDAAVLNLDAKREHLGLFAASAVVPQAYGVSPHQEGNNIYGAYGRIDGFLAQQLGLEPFFLWRMQPKEVVQSAAGKTTGKEDEKAYGVRLKGQAHSAFDYGGEAILEQRQARHTSSSVWRRSRAFLLSGTTRPATKIRRRAHRTPPSIPSTRQPTTDLESLTCSAGRTSRRYAWAQPLSPTRGSPSRCRGWTFGRLMLWTRSTTPKAARS
jgi:hypothetical protein